MDKNELLVIVPFWSELNGSEQKKLALYIDASKRYYDGGELLINDTLFNELEEELLNCGNDKIKEFISTHIWRNGQMVNASQLNYEMISLEKIKFENRSAITEINAFFRPSMQRYGWKSLFFGPKFDGAALKRVLDKKGKLISIISRGGLDVTEKFRNVKGIMDFPNYLTTNGELVINKKTFEEKYLDDWVNERNFIGKLMKEKNISSDILNDLEYIPCTDGVNPIPNMFVWSKVDTLSEIYSNITEQYNYYKSAKFPFRIDGCVIAFNTFSNDRLIKDNYPLNMVAVKFPAVQVQTKVLEFIWTQKKSGKLTPKLRLEPVDVDGSTIEFCAVYNYEWVLNNRIGIGSIILLEKSNDIIPKVVKTLVNSSNINMPDVQYTRQGKHLVAVNMDESNIHKFKMAIKLFGIEGIGDVTATNIANELDSDIIELFNPEKKSSICQAIGGGKLWQKFNDEFYQIKTIRLDLLIQLMQFDQVGSVLSKKIALLITKKSNDVSNIPDNVINTVCRGEGFKQITDNIKQLKLFGINVIMPDENTDTITFEMSGEPQGMSKAEFVSRFKKIVPNSVATTLTKSTKFLFVDSLTSASGKTNKARKYGVKIITYVDALNGKF